MITIKVTLYQTRLKNYDTANRFNPSGEAYGSKPI
jgi:hypothetical protein